MRCSVSPRIEAAGASSAAPEEAPTAAHRAITRTARVTARSISLRRLVPERVIDLDMTPEEDAYHALCSYTLARRDAEFIHQHVVDAYMAQRADERTKPIALTFALVGLYLTVADLLRRHGIV
jgi:hypothetical protein